MQSTHLTPETALDFLEQRLDSDHALLWKQHLKECARCMQYLAEWQHLLVVIKRSNLKSASEQDVEWAAGIFPDFSSILSVEPCMPLRCILDYMVFDILILSTFDHSRYGPSTRLVYIFT